MSSLFLLVQTAFIAPIEGEEPPLNYSGWSCFQNHTIVFVNYCWIRDSLNSEVKVVRDKRRLREFRNV
jgi:hypothetical protein